MTWVWGPIRQIEPIGGANRLLVCSNQDSPGNSECRHRKPEKKYQLYSILKKKQDPLDSSERAKNYESLYTKLLV